MNKCKGTKFHFDNNGNGNIVDCQNGATTYRKGWRFGNNNQGEKAILETRTYLCQECAERWDDSEAEMAAEAAGS